MGRGEAEGSTRRRSKAAAAMRAALLYKRSGDPPVSALARTLAIFALGLFTWLLTVAVLLLDKAIQG